MLVLEMQRHTDASVTVTLSLPGRVGASTRHWGGPVPWEDIQAHILQALSDWLWLTGGAQLVLDGRPVEHPSALFVHASAEDAESELHSHE